MRVAIVFVTLVFASTAFLIQPSSAQVPGTGDLYGSVCAASWDCEPLPGATVSLQGGLLGTIERETTTDEAGSYRFEDLPDGSYDVTVSRTGFASLSQEVGVSGATQVDFELNGTEVDVTGQVVDADGEGVSAHVWLHGPQWHETTTAADGRFSLRTQAGWYEVRVEAPRQGTKAERLLIDGTDVVLELTPPPGQDARVEGRVTDQDGQPVADVDVRVEQYEAVHADGTRTYQHYGNWTRTDAQGRYSVSVFGGSVSLSFSREGHAQEYRWVEVGAGKTQTVDVELLRYPEKTARIEGKVTDAAGEGLRYVSISIQHPEYGLWECSTRGTGSGHAGPEPGYADMAYSPRAYEGCAITVHDDGSFTGNVTPGYAILQVRYDRWAACDETHHADGSYERKCGPDYFQHSQTMDLEADAANEITVALKQRPGPDAAVSGYLVDQETQKAIPRAHISFGHQDSHSWGSASTDGDGSYQVRVRSGLHHVSVWAEGYLPWEGTIEVKSGSETPFDVLLTAGEARYGGCCYTEVAYADAQGRSVAEPSSAPRGASSDGPQNSGGSSDAFEDMGGGLGPYDAAKRAQLLETPSKKDAPLPLVVAVGAIALAGLRRRR